MTVSIKVKNNNRPMKIQRTILDNNSKPKNLASDSIKLGIQDIITTTNDDSIQTRAYFTGIRPFLSK